MQRFRDKWLVQLVGEGTQRNKCLRGSVKSTVAWDVLESQGRLQKVGTHKQNPMVIRKTCSFGCGHLEKRDSQQIRKNQLGGNGTQEEENQQKHYHPWKDKILRLWKRKSRKKEHAENKNLSSGLKTWSQFNGRGGGDGAEAITSRCVRERFSEAKAMISWVGRAH